MANPTPSWLIHCNLDRDPNHRRGGFNYGIPKSYILPPPPLGLPSYFVQVYNTYIPSRSWVTNWMYTTTCYLNHRSLTYNNAWYLVVLSMSQYKAVIDVIGSVEGIYAFIYWTKGRFGQVWSSRKAIYNYTCTYLPLILHTTNMYYMVTTSIGGGPTVLNYGSGAGSRGSY